MTPEETLNSEMRVQFPYREYKREQEVISRHKIYRTTAIYTTYTIIILVMAIRSGHVLQSLAIVPIGVFFWMMSEYLSHRYVFHHKFEVDDSTPMKKFFTTIGAKYLVPMHTGHHERPFDGKHMSGRIRDLLPLFIIGVLLATFVFPPFTLSVIVATWFQCYIAEEWIHHATHFYNFRDPYFRYMKKHHMYHHTKAGMKYGFGTTSGIIDYFLNSRYPEDIRKKLYGAKKALAGSGGETQS